MAVPAGIVVAWPGTAASIPSGWSRKTTLDARYTKGSPTSTDPDATGGAATHGHGTASHIHSRNHSHTASGTWGEPPFNNATLFTISTWDQIDRQSSQAHSITGAPTVNGNVTGATPTWQTAGSDPSFFEVIWIESDGTPAGIPDGGVAWFDAATPPTDWIQHVGSKARFLKGAAAAGDGGGTGGGGTHAHSPTANHSHTADHNHPTALSGISGSSGNESEVGGNQLAIHQHKHTQTFASATVSTSSVSSNASGNATYEPPFHTLLAIENTKGSDSLPNNLIALWLGLLASVPSGWVLCDGLNGTPDLRDRFVKAANVGGDVGTTGGSDGHSHSAPGAHSHTIASHSHAITISTSHDRGGVLWNSPSGGPGTYINYLHEHAGSPSTNASAPGTGSTATTIDSTADTQPPLRTVAHIQFQITLDVTIDSPVEDATVTQPDFLADWSLSLSPPNGGATQNDYCVQIYSDAAGTVQVYDSGTVVSATTGHTLPTQWGNGPFNGTGYWIRVTATDDGGIQGVSALRHVTTAWMPPTQVTALTATAVT